LFDHFSPVFKPKPRHRSRPKRGGDHVSDWEGKLTARIVLFSNELLRMQDQSGALASRFVVWQMRESFLGREDPDLTNKLLAERPGILNLALDALDRVRSRQPRPGVLQCESGLDMSQDLADLLSDVKVFVDDCCDIGPEYEVLVAALFARWQLWCAQCGIRHSWGDKQFSAKVVSVVPTIRRGRPRETPTHKTKLLGIRLASSLNKKSGEIER
jgi:putative DNA primase/helicase